MERNLVDHKCYFTTTDHAIKPYPIYVADVVHRYGSSVAPHTHGHYEFSLFLSGEVDVVVGQNEYTLSPGDLLLTMPGDIHQFSSKRYEDWRFLYFGIGQIAPEELRFHYMKNRRRQFHDCWEFRPLLEKMIEEVRKSSFGVQYVLSAVMTEILYLLARRIAPTTRDRQVLCDAVGIARAYIDANPCHGIRIKDIAATCCLSESRLSHVFAEKTGMTLSGYITYVLMHSAIMLLEDNQRSISDIAGQLGYPSPQYFSRVFKKFWGYSPRECRRALKRTHCVRFGETM